MNAKCLEQQGQPIPFLAHSGNYGRLPWKFVFSSCNIGVLRVYVRTEIGSWQIGIWNLADYDRALNHVSIKSEREI